MQVQLGNNKYQIQIVELNNNILELNNKLDINDKENILFKSNITNLQLDIINKNSIINELTLKVNNISNDCDSYKVQLLELNESSQKLYHNCITKIQDVIIVNNSLQDKLDNVESINLTNIDKYNEIKLKYQNILIKYEDLNILNYDNISKQIDITKELNLYKELNSIKITENETLSNQILMYIDKVNLLNRNIFEKDDYLKNLQKKYVNEKPINIISVDFKDTQENTQENAQENTQETQETQENTQENIQSEKMTFQRGIKKYRK